jgi:hypothetical protein
MLPPLKLALSGRAVLATRRIPLPISQTTRITYQHIVKMSSHTKQQKNKKFGHLPLSTSGPQETSLTVQHPSLSRSVALTHPRAMHSSEHHTSTRALRSQKKSATFSNFIASSRRISRRLTSKSSAHTPSTAPAQTTSPRIHS